MGNPSSSSFLPKICTTHFKHLAIRLRRPTTSFKLIFGNYSEANKIIINSRSGANLESLIRQHAYYEDGIGIRSCGKCIYRYRKLTAINHVLSRCIILIIILLPPFLRISCTVHLNPLFKFTFINTSINLLLWAIEDSGKSA